jgi:Bacterial PH domain
MSLINNLFGNASQVNGETVMPYIADFIIEKESVITAYKLWRDMIVFTSERLIYIDIQGLTGTKVSYNSIPYSSIKSFTMETAGTFDMDCEITLSGHGIGTIPLKFARGTDLKPVYKYLSHYILRDN